MNEPNENNQEFIFVDPKNDVAFRKIFGDENKKEILISFLNNILEFSGTDKEITDITIKNPYQVPKLKELTKICLAPNLPLFFLRFFPHLPIFLTSYLPSFRAPLRNLVAKTDYFAWHQIRKSQIALEDLGFRI